MNYLKRMRFTRHDLINVVTNPRKAGKAYASAAAAFVISWLAERGFDAPGEIDDAAIAVAAHLGGAALAFAAAWLIPND